MIGLRRVDERRQMNLDQAMARLEALSDDAVRARNARNGAGDNQFGAKLGDIRTLAKEIKKDHALALELWATENIDARLLAILLMKPKDLSRSELDAMVRSATFPQLADWLNAYIVKVHPEAEALRLEWLTVTDPMAARAGWSLTADRVAKGPAALDLPALLDRLASDMATAPPEAQWTMNTCLATIGIQFPEHRERALAIGETLGLYRDYPVAKGCTSPFAPIWINEMVRRQG